MCHPSQTPILQGSCTIAEKKCTSNNSRDPKITNWSPYVISNAHKVYEYVTNTSNLGTMKTHAAEANEVIMNQAEAKLFRLERLKTKGAQHWEDVQKWNRIVKPQVATHLKRKCNNQNSGPNKSEDKFERQNPK